MDSPVCMLLSSWSTRRIWSCSRSFNIFAALIARGKKSLCNTWVIHYSIWASDEMNLGSYPVLPFYIDWISNTKPQLKLVTDRSGYILCTALLNVSAIYLYLAIYINFYFLRIGLTIRFLWSVFFPYNTEPMLSMHISVLPYLSMHSFRFLHAACYTDQQ